MLFLARFALKGVSQAALVAATLAMLGLIFPPAAWISSAAIALVTLVYGFRQGILVMAISIVGSAIFAALIFGAPHVAMVFALLAWLPVWIAAATLKQTVSMAASLQLMTAISLLGVIIIYTLFPEFAEFWREQFDFIVTQIASQSDELQLSELRQVEERVLALLPGLFASSILFTTMLSLYLARWWQSIFYNPGGFSKEYQSLNLGNNMGLFTVGLGIAAVLMKTDVTFSLLLVISSVYLMQGSAIMHAVFASKQLNAVWLYLVYILMLFVPHIVVLLAFIGLVDTWIDIRRRFGATL